MTRRHHRAGPSPDDLLQRALRGLPWIAPWAGRPARPRYDVQRWTRVTIPDDMAARADAFAADIYKRADRAGWEHRAFVAGNDARANVRMGIHGEAALAHWLRVPFTPDRDGFSSPDVAGYHVRSRRPHDPRLNIQPQDLTRSPDRVFVLAVAVADRVFDLVGWMTPAMAARTDDWDDPGGIGRPALFLAPDRLMGMPFLPMTDELRAIRTAAPAVRP